MASTAYQATSDTTAGTEPLLLNESLPITVAVGGIRYISVIAKPRFSAVPWYTDNASTISVTSLPDQYPGGCGGPSPVLLHTYIFDRISVDITATPTVAPTPGNLLVMSSATRGSGLGPTAITGWNTVAPGVVSSPNSPWATRDFAMFWRIAQVGDVSWTLTGSSTHYTYTEWQGVTGLTGSVSQVGPADSLAISCGGDITTNGPALLIGAITAGFQNDTETLSAVAISPAIELDDKRQAANSPGWFSAYRFVSSVGTYSILGTGTSGSSSGVGQAGITAAFGLRTLNPIIRQFKVSTAANVFDTGGAAPTLTLDSPPIQGNMLVAAIASEDSNASGTDWHPIGFTDLVQGTCDTASQSIALSTKSAGFMESSVISCSGGVGGRAAALGVWELNTVAIDQSGHVDDGFQDDNPIVGPVLTIVDSGVLIIAAYGRIETFDTTSTLSPRGGIEEDAFGRHTGGRGEYWFGHRYMTQGESHTYNITGPFMTDHAGKKNAKVGATFYGTGIGEASLVWNYGDGL